ncbi:uncharacterized protein [Typha angustifolia]|uniref:uncharacterized protein isoform X1 n=1 Tax=Typha angustifolia TaxID=59011 RepID=UPI003C2E3EED
MNGGGVGGGGPIPAAARKLVRIVKEIVNCPEAEIYAALKDCNMDPDEAVHRLLSEDTFCEVKSKREKKKEIKENPEPRPRAVSNVIRGTRGGTDRNSRSNSFQSSSSDHPVSRVKTAQKRENEANSLPTSSILGPGKGAANPYQNPTALSAVSCKMLSADKVADSSSMPSQPSSGFQPNWSGMAGHLSMADIVKMGRPQGKSSSAYTMASDRSYTLQTSATSNLSNHSFQQPSSTDLLLELDREMAASQGPVSHNICTSHDTNIGDDRHTSLNGQSLADEPLAERGSTLPETSGSSSLYVEPSESSTLLIDAVNPHGNSHLDETQEMEENVKASSAKSIRSSSASDRQIEQEVLGNNSNWNEDLSKNMNGYQSQRDHFENDEVEDVHVDVSAAAANFQQLSLHEEELGTTKSAEDNPAVIIPNHLQVTNAECAHLSFGSFASGTFSGSYVAKPMTDSLEGAPVSNDSSSVDQLGATHARNHEYYDNGQVSPPSNESVATRSGTNTENLDMPLVSQPDITGTDTLDSTHGFQFNLPSVSGYAFSNATLPNAAEYTYTQGNVQLQNLSPFSSVMQVNPLQSSLVAPSISTLQDFDHAFSPFRTTQSMPTKYNMAASSIDGSIISMQETLKPGVFSHSQTTQTLPSTSIPTGPPPPQHLPVHHYPQPTMPLGPFANMISYPFLPQSYTYLPSATFQQPYSSNGLFHQSAAAVPSSGIKYTLPQYKSSIPDANLPQVSSVVSGYGGFESLTNVPVSLGLNQGTASSSTTFGFEEALRSQYKDASHYMSLQQNDNPALWVQGAGSRSVSALPTSNLNGYQGQQISSLRLAQQPLPISALGYPSFYHSQTGVAQEHQNPKEANLNGPQTTPSQLSRHTWQNSY